MSWYIKIKLFEGECVPRVFRVVCIRYVCSFAVSLCFSVFYVHRVPNVSEFCVSVVFSEFSMFVVYLMSPAFLVWIFCVSCFK